MPQSKQSITLHLEKTLVNDLQSMADSLGLNVPEVIHRAITHELARLEKERSHNDSRLAHLQTDILSQAQSLSLSMEGEEEQGTICEICLVPITGAQRPVEGPLLCNACMSLARSGEVPAAF